MFSFMNHFFTNYLNTRNASIKVAKYETLVIFIFFIFYAATGCKIAHNKLLLNR